MTKQALSITGWLAFVDAAIQIPIVVLYVFAQEWAGVSGGKVIEASLNVVSLALYAFLTLRFKQFLNEHFHFHQTDTLIQAMIVVNAVVIGVTVIAIIAEPLESLSLVFAVIALIVLGIVGMVFSTKLLRLPDELYGLLKPYSYTYMASSLLTATVILVPLGLVVGVVSTVMMGIIFFRAAEQS